jgi:DHA1 family florfenicol/chloramphenicol resistance protein-like MFS transporter
MPTQTRPAWPQSLPAALLLLAPFNLLASLGMDIYLPAVPTMPAALGASPSLVQLTLSLYMVVLGVGQIAFGPLSDRIGRRPVLIAGGLLFAAASLLLAAASSGRFFLALRLAQAVGASAALVAIFATVRDVYAHQPQGAVVYSLLNAMLAFVPALGPIAGALILDGFGWRAVFVALGAAACAAALQAWARWAETRPAGERPPGGSFRPILRSGAFWTYALGFSAAMGAFFVFFSTAPRVLIGRAGYSELAFSLAFATTAAVMIATTRFASGFVARWGVAGSVARGMAMLLAGGGLLAAGQMLLPPSFLSFVAPMWLIAVGIIVTASVTANGALEAFGDAAGTAVALYSCVQSLIVGVVGTLAVVLLDGDTAWPLAAYAMVMPLATLGGLAALRRRPTPT